MEELKLIMEAVNGLGEAGLKGFIAYMAFGFGATAIKCITCLLIVLIIMKPVAGLINRGAQYVDSTE